jgi:predicted GIY-YIG superfamily endonuclease
VNLNGNGSFRSAFTFAMPIKKIKSNLNLNWGFSYSRTPGLINNVTNLAHNYTLNGGFLMGSNISKDLDFSIGYNTAYIWVINSIQPENNNNYLTGNGTFRFNWMPWKGLVLTTDLSNSIYRGLSSTFNQQIWLWNAGLGYKFLKEKQAEVRLIAFDLLKQNQSINRLVTETYVEDTNTSILQQYFMVSFIYNVRNFAKPTMPPTPGPKKP